MAITRRKLLIGGGVVVAAGAAGVLTPMIRQEAGYVPGKPRVGFVEGTEGPLPKQADVVVIGGGILGIMTAINLVERGLSVVVLEKGNIAGEQSSRFYGQAITYRIPDATFMLHHLGKARWREMNKKIGADTSYRTQGRVDVPANEEDLEVVRKWIDEKNHNHGSEVPFKTRIIQGKELDQRLRGATSEWKIAGFEEDSGSFDPEIATFVIANYAKKIGVKIYTQCAARGLETQAGVISDVVTEKGAIKTSQVIVAGGVWSRMFMKNLGVSIPTLPAFQSQQLISAAPNAPGANVALPGNIFFREQADGTYATSPRVVVVPLVKESFFYGYKYLPLINDPDFPVHIALNSLLYDSIMEPTTWKLNEVSPFEKYRDMTAVADLRELNASLETLKKEFPAFKDSKIIDQWSGAMAVAPDECAIISEVKEYKGLILNTGTSWGMTESPVSSEIAADLLLGKEPPIDIKGLSLYRFS